MAMMGRIDLRFRRIGTGMRAQADFGWEGLERWNVTIPATGDQRADAVTLLRHLADDLEAKGERR